ncbi:MAG: signal peptidase I [Anaerolineales bacterium]|nr:signal peptidase I [Anaerolineales bacterium]
MESLQPESLIQPEPTPEKRSGWRRVLIDIIETVVIAAVLFLGINAISARVRVDSISMEPTLFKDNYVLVNKLGHKIGSPDRGDIVVFRYPPNPDEQYIKRVVGLPGDRIHISGGKVFVNDEILSEPYISVQTKSGGDWVIPEDSLFVLGDNRNNSRDSRFWGVVPFENLVGKAFAVYWPPESWRVLTFPFAAAAER